MSHGTTLRERLVRGAPLLRRLTTPLLPGDYLSLLDPLLAQGLRARVTEVRREAGGAVTLVLQPGPGWDGHRAGQWIRVGVDIAGVLQHRSYSLTAPPREDGRISITVKPQAGGTVSPHLATAVNAGDVVRLEQAAGVFTLPAPLPAAMLFVTAGSGVTPVMGMLRELATQGELPDVVMVHSALTPADVIFGEELRAMAAAHPRFRLVERHTELDGLLTTEQLTAMVPDWRRREAWACGPAGLLDALEQHYQAWGRAELLRTERFAPAVLPGLEGAGGTLTLHRAGTTVEVVGATTLLDAAESVGALMPSGCRMGICFGCVVPLTSGAVRDVRDGCVTSTSATDPAVLVQTCISVPAGDVVLDV